MTLDTIDERLLDFTKKFCNKTYQLVGINNFLLVKIANIMGMTLFFNLFLFNRKIDILGIVFLVLITFGGFFRFMYLTKLESVLKKEFVNPNRLLRKSGRHFCIVVIPVLVFIDFRIVIYENLDMKLQALSHSGGLILFFFMYDYLISVEPSPPSQSKLKRLLNRISSFRLKGLAPSPA